MFHRIRNNTGLTVAFVGVLIVTSLSCLWNFTHAYILAGGDNPLSLLEGQWPHWNGAALAVALASVGSDLLKVMAGFILFGAFANKRGWKRVGAVALALILIIPTLAWSARSATGMIALVFGDTIATRGNEKVAAQSLAARIEQGQARLAWLERQTSDVGAVRRANAKEAAELRTELKQNRVELRSAKGIGGADPGSQVIASVTGMAVEKVTNLTIVLFIVMVEICSILGWPALALAAAVAETEQPSTKDHEEREPRHKGDKRFSPSAKLNGSLENFDHKTTSASPPVSNAFTPLREALEVIAKRPKAVEPSLDEDAAATHGKGKRAERRGRPRFACLGDGHIEEYVDHCEAVNAKADRSSYVDFCKTKYLTPMATAKMWQGVRRYRRVGKENILRYFEPKRAGINGEAIRLPH